MRNLSNPTSLEAGALKRIATNLDGEILKKYLKQELALTDEANRILEGANLHRSQGQALTLKAILDLLEAR